MEDDDDDDYEHEYNEGAKAMMSDDNDLMKREEKVDLINRREEKN